jgi:hypothetical protein
MKFILQMEDTKEVDDTRVIPNDLEYQSWMFVKQNGDNFLEELNLFMKNGNDEYELVKTTQANIAIKII